MRPRPQSVIVSWRRNQAVCAPLTRSCGRMALPASRRQPMAKSKKQKKTRKPVKRAAPAKKKVAYIPSGCHTLTPHLVCRGAAEAIDFYIKAFGARQKIRMAGPDGKIMHAELLIGNSIVMLGDEAPQMGATAPPTIGGTASGLL